VTSTVNLIGELTQRALSSGTSLDPIVPRPTRHGFNVHLDGLEANASVAGMPVPAGRLSFLKKLVLAPARFFLVRQQSANLATASALRALADHVEFLEVELRQERQRSAAALAAAEGISRSFETRANERASAQDAILNSALSAIDSVRADVQSSTAALGNEVTQLATRLNSDGPLLRRVADVQHLQTARISNLERGLQPGTEAPTSLHLASAAEPARDSVTRTNGRGVRELTDDFYERFERHFRPTLHAGTTPLDHYRDVLADVIYPSTPLLDVGCGRGDFIEALTQAGFPALGIDMNAAAVLDATERGLQAECVDALSYLTNCRPESFGAITMLHIAEHLEPTLLIEVLDGAMRALVPGGVLVVETPNPSNVVVGASAFYNDPTHLRPLTPAFLSFVLNDRGFTDVETRFFSPRDAYERILGAVEREVDDADMAELMREVCWSLLGPQDMAVIGRRSLHE
jgi:SAM-dependent methyltransferase